MDDVCACRGWRLLEKRVEKFAHTIFRLFHTRRNEVFQSSLSHFSLFLHPENLYPRIFRSRCASRDELWVDVCLLINEKCYHRLVAMLFWPDPLDHIIIVDVVLVRRCVFCEKPFCTGESKCTHIVDTRIWYHFRHSIDAKRKLRESRIFSTENWISIECAGEFGWRLRELQLGLTHHHRQKTAQASHIWCSREMMKCYKQGKNKTLRKYNFCRWVKRIGGEVALHILHHRHIYQAFSRWKRRGDERRRCGKRKTKFSVCRVFREMCVRLLSSNDESN